MSQPHPLEEQLHEAGEMEKDIKHNQDVVSSGGLFYPLIAETLGMWSAHRYPYSQDYIAMRTALKYNISISQSVTNLHQQLSVRLWQYNSKMMLDRIALEAEDLVFALLSCVVCLVTFQCIFM